MANASRLDGWLLTLLGTNLTLFIAFGVALACVRYLREQRRKASLQALASQEAEIYAWLEGRSRQAAKFKGNPELRDFLVRLAGQLKGDLLGSLLSLYAELGFAAADLKALKSYSFQRRVDALQRARSLNFPLPNEAWNVLLSRDGPGWKWAVLELLVQRKGKNALPWLFAYSLEEKGRERGMWTYLFMSVARQSPQAVAFILAHVDDSFFQLVCLEVLAAYPVPHASELIVRLATADAPLATIQACVRALEGHPGSAAMRCLNRLAAHDNEEVRRLVARAFLAWQGDESAVPLEALAVDLAYRVREAAVQALAVGGHRCMQVLDTITSDPDHPAYNLVAQHCQAEPTRLTAVSGAA